MKNLPKDRTVDQRLDSIERRTGRNFDHWEGEYRALVKRFNSLVTDLAAIQEFLDIDPLPEHTHEDADEGGTILASAVDHGGLSGLADDDHPQYATDTDLTNHAAAADPHTGYRLESADHTHQSTGAQAGKLDHGLALDGLTDDDHTQYQKESEKGAASGYASLDAGTKVPTAELGGAGADATKFLRGDQSWQVPAGGSGGHTIQDEGTPLTARTNLNFTGAGVTVTDDAGNDQTDVTISGGGSGITVQEEDTTVDAAATTLDFDGSDFNLTSEAGNEVRVALAYGTGAGTPAEGNHSHAGGTFSPLDYGGLVAWWKADDPMMVERWADASNPLYWENSGQGEFQPQLRSFGTGTPSYETNEVNSLPVLRFDGTDDAFRTNDLDFFSPFATGSMTMFVVCKGDDLDGTQCLFGKAANPYEWELRFVDASVDRFMFTTYASAGASNNSVQYGSDNVAGTWYIVAVRMLGNASLPEAELKLWRNGGAGVADTTFADDMSNTASRVFVGERGDGTHNYFDGDIAEILYYSRALSHSMMDDIFDYLGTKYNITVSACS